MKAVSPLSVPEIGDRKKSNESTEKGEEENNSAKSDKMTNEEKIKKTPPTPKISYNVEGDLDGYKTTQMDIKLAEIFDGEYVRNNDGTHLDGGIADDLIW